MNFTHQSSPDCTLLRDNYTEELFKLFLLKGPSRIVCYQVAKQLLPGTSRVDFPRVKPSGCAGIFQRRAEDGILIKESSRDRGRGGIVSGKSNG